MSLKTEPIYPKGFNIINCFSEDIDIQIYPPENMEISSGKNHTKEKHEKKRKEYFDTLATTIKIDSTKKVVRDEVFDDKKYRRLARV